MDSSDPCFFSDNVDEQGDEQHALRETLELLLGKA